MGTAARSGFRSPVSFAFCRAVLFSGDAVHARELIASGDERTALGRRKHAIFVIGQTCIILRRIAPDIDRFRKNFTLRLAPLSPTTKSTDTRFSRICPYSFSQNVMPSISIFTISFVQSLSSCVFSGHTFMLSPKSYPRTEVISYSFP